MAKHKSVSILISCIDFRFWPQALPMLQKKFGRMDLIVLAGGAKNLSSPLEHEDKTVVLENIAISIKLHSAKNIILTTHEDCGAYGGSKKFSSQFAETEFHRKELQKAAKFVKKHFPRLRIKTFL